VDKKRSLESAEADSACFLRSGGVDQFFKIFFAKFKLIIVFRFSGKFCGVTSNMPFADTALASFSMFRVLFLHLLCVTMYAKSNTIWTFKIKRLGLLVYPPARPFSNTCGFAIC